MPAGDAVIEVQGVSKRFARDLRRSLRYAVQDIGRELWPLRRHAHPPRPGEFSAVEDVSFSLAQGESLALIGANGAGKTTLLKLMSGLIKPDSGVIRIHGRAAALIELGTGFDPILTGRENIVVNAAILGLPRRRVAEAVDEIVAFAELEDAIDAPLRTYSSGMVARLAFAVAALLEPDVLLIDEVFAVGDVAFQRKCVRHIRSFVRAGGALLLVSHNAPQIQATCERGLVLEHGRCTFTGGVVDALSHYLSSELAGGDRDAPLGPREPSERDPVIIDELIVQAPGQAGLISGTAAQVELRYRSVTEADVVWGFSIWTADQWVCITGAYDMRPLSLCAGAGTRTVTIPRLPLLTGQYVLRAAIVDAESLMPLALYGYDDAPLPLRVTAPPSLQSNGTVHSHQLTTLDVDWE